MQQEHEGDQRHDDAFLKSVVRNVSMADKIRSERS